MSPTLHYCIEAAKRVAAIHDRKLRDATDPILCRRIYRLHRLLVQLDHTIEQQGYTTPAIDRQRAAYTDEITQLLTHTSKKILPTK